MALLNKSAILGAEDLKHEDVEVPQWGGSVRVRLMTGAERDEFRTFIADFKDGAPISTFSAALLVNTCIDEAGARMFTMDDMDQLREKSGAALDVLTGAAMRLNGLGGAAEQETVKNSVSGQSDDSGSDSPKS